MQPRAVFSRCNQLWKMPRRSFILRSCTSALQTRSFSISSRYAADNFENVRDMFDLKGRNYVVTGGGQGIGFAVTHAITEMGGNVAVLDLRKEPVEAFNSLASNFGVKTHYLQTDVTKEESLNNAFSEAVEKLGSVDGLVPAAGIALDKPFEEQSWEEANRVFQVNFMGTFFATQLAVKQMLKQGTPGSIALIASVTAHIVAPGHKLASYSSSKGAVLMLSRELAVEFAPHNIRFNTISPGYIESDMTRELRQKFPHLVKIMHSAPPMKRIGNPNDLTAAIIYLLSDASKYTTGSDILITGGLHAGRIEA